MEEKCVTCRYGSFSVTDEPCRSCVYGLGTANKWEVVYDEEEDEDDDS